MTTKAENPEQDSAVARRKPRQARALYKIGLILEATMRLLDQGDIESLNTNAIAELAGVSIGTVYQYFDGKQAILDMLVDQELGDLIDGVLLTLAEPAPAALGDRVRRIVGAVSAAFGGRSRVHQQLLQHSLNRGRSARFQELYKATVDIIASPGFTLPGQKASSLSAAEAFVLTYAVAGVMRGLIIQGDNAPASAEVEQALIRLVTAFACTPEPDRDQMIS